MKVTRAELCMEFAINSKFKLFLKNDKCTQENQLVKHKKNVCCAVCSREQRKGKAGARENLGGGGGDVGADRVVKNGEKGEEVEVFVM